MPFLPSPPTIASATARLLATAQAVLDGGDEWISEDQETQMRRALAEGANPEAVFPGTSPRPDQPQTVFAHLLAYCHLSTPLMQAFADAGFPMARLGDAPGHHNAYLTSREAPASVRMFMGRRAHFLLTHGARLHAPQELAQRFFSRAGDAEVTRAMAALMARPETQQALADPARQHPDAFHRLMFVNHTKPVPVEQKRWWLGIARQWGGDIHSINKGGYPVLHKHIHDARLLLEAGADPHATDAHGNSMVHRAAQAQSLDGLEALLAAGASPWVANGVGNTPLHEDMAVAVAQTVLAKCVPGVNPLNTPNHNGDTPLHTLIQRLLAGSGYHEETNEKGAHLLRLAHTMSGHPFHDRANAQGFTVMDLALQAQVHGVLRGVLEQGADPNVPNAAGLSPLEALLEGELRAKPALADADAYRRPGWVLGVLPCMEALLDAGALRDPTPELAALIDDLVLQQGPRLQQTAQALLSAHRLAQTLRAVEPQASVIPRIRL